MLNEVVHMESFRDSCAMNDDQIEREVHILAPLSAQLVMARSDVTFFGFGKLQNLHISLPKLISEKCGCKDFQMFLDNETNCSDEAYMAA